MVVYTYVEHPSPPIPRLLLLSIFLVEVIKCANKIQKKTLSAFISHRLQRKKT